MFSIPLARGHIEQQRRRHPLPKFCSIDGCGEPVSARGFCMRHYQRWYRNGDPVMDGYRAPRHMDGLSNNRRWKFRAEHWDRWLESRMSPHRTVLAAGIAEMRSLLAARDKR